MPVPFWAGHYIGLPFREHGRDRSGLDCWGLARLVLAEQSGIALPSFDYAYRRTSDTLRIGDLIDYETQKWQRVEKDAEQCGDLIILRLRGRPMHIGLVLGDRQMLHIEQGIDSAIERYNAPRWKDRLHGFYRYKPFGYS